MAEDIKPVQNEDLLASSKPVAADEPVIKKEPDEDKPSLIGNPPNQLDALPVKNKDDDNKHLKQDEDLLEEPRKVEDGLL